MPLSFRSLLIAWLCALAAPSVASAAPPSLAIQAPPVVRLGQTATITYIGESKPAGHTEMRLTGFRELESTGCAPSALEQGERLNSKRAGMFYPPAGPFSLSTQVEFLETGVWRVCAYLQKIAPAGEPPAVLAEATILVSADERPEVAACKVPRLVGLTLGKARSALRKAGCALGRVTRARRVGGRPLVVVKQEVRPGSRLPKGRPVDVVVGSRRR